jgi:hypothetical protein
MDRSPEPRPTHLLPLLHRPDLAPKHKQSSDRARNGRTLRGRTRHSQISNRGRRDGPGSRGSAGARARSPLGPRPPPSRRPGWSAREKGRRFVSCALGLLPAVIWWMLCWTPAAYRPICIYCTIAHILNSSVEINRFRNL